MSEYFERYRHFKRRETNGLIDADVKIIKGFTKEELLVLPGGMFILSMFPLPGFLQVIVLLLSFSGPFVLRYCRNKFYRGYFNDLAWYLNASERPRTNRLEPGL